MEDLLLHQSTRLSLSNFLESPYQSVLLKGSVGLGKTTIAHNIITELLDIPIEKLSNNQYVRRISPEKGAISIDQIRTLLSFFKLKADFKVGYNRFVIIDDADLMSKEAQNALLKMLEEPPDKSMFVLVASEPERLLATIRSRTQIISVLVPNIQSVLDYFKTLNFNEHDIKQAWLRSDCSIVETANILKHTSADNMTLNMVKQVLSDETFKRLLLVNEIAKDKQVAIDFIRTLSQIASASIEQSAITKSGSLKRWYRVLSASQVAENALSHNGNPKLVLTDLMLTM